MKRLTFDGRHDGDNEGRRFSWLLVHFAGLFVHGVWNLCAFWLALGICLHFDASLIVATRAHHLGAKDP
jgi:hypothetical protein